jgi:hypothetical protein
VEIKDLNLNGMVKMVKNSNKKVKKLILVIIFRVGFTECKLPLRASPSGEARDLTRPC